jgi:hypothetical protein
MSEHEEARVTDQGGSASARWGGASLLLFLVGFAVSLVIGWVLFPQVLYSQKTQPFDFNHAVHTEKQGMACDDCHKFGDDGRFSGAPKFQECLACHTWSERQNEESKAETEFLEKFVDKDSDELIGNPQWYIYSAQPDCVFFSHVAHTKMGGITCEECHGDHGKTTSLRPFFQNRITRYSKDIDWAYKSKVGMKMTDCGDCHDKKGKPENNACFVCHK